MRFSFIGIVLQRQMGTECKVNYDTWSMQQNAVFNQIIIKVESFTAKIQKNICSLISLRHANLIILIMQAFILFVYCLKIYLWGS